uniref:Uncharacterized protein n=1 Tax=Anopheles farauti TaxID=69004 RepID=A0A182QH56_9DIPT
MKPNCVLKRAPDCVLATIHWRFSGTRVRQFVYISALGVAFCVLRCVSALVNHPSRLPAGVTEQTLPPRAFCPPPAVSSVYLSPWTSPNKPKKAVHDIAHLFQLLARLPMSPPPSNACCDETERYGLR